MKLKQYQTDTLSLLCRFFEKARIAGPKNAYEAITKEPELAGRLGRYAEAYKPLAGLPNVPYVCLRLPTGGGKTILGAYAIRTARDAWIEKDHPLVLWLVPTNTIRRQTAEALKEGWDCSFAYVFCSVSRIRSAVDVEQLLGRVLRMPYARRRQAADLNKAHAFVCEPSFGDAARALADKLVAMGFEEAEARDNIEPVQRPMYEDGDLFRPTKRPKPMFRVTLTVSPEGLTTLKNVKHERMTVGETHDGQAEIAVTGHVDDHLEKAIYKATPKAQHPSIGEAIATYRTQAEDQLSPAERGETLNVPRLMAEIQGTLEFADTDTFMEFHDWRLLDHSPRMEADEFAIRETARSFEIDVDGNRVTYQFANEHEQLSLNVEIEDWTPEALVLWLDRQVRQIDIHPSMLLKWLRDLVGYLLNVRHISISALMRCKFILARKIQDKIDGIRRKERHRIYQRYLFAPAAKTTVSFDHSFSFKEDMYGNQRRYRGHWKPLKHFLGPDQVPAFDGAADGEEFQCAQALDFLPGLRYWVRNAARHPDSFWLPTATDKFYPDFVALLDDARLLVVEYKGAHIADSSDTAEKRTIGELWERESGGKGLFLVAENTVGGKDVRQQLIDKAGIA